ncbi:IS1096 element passenger TnpR family protein [Nocardia sp. CDC160]|uniref:IS1096 element passenger TnpR family protein n=1 Tax=Nocardia sp. CDC160 TaxID=3112166 RepID=UPI002DB95273|nr:hypothetical protein [Nocardia sp. CDC160]MEC3920192.1 hypothetical protein [Nocardia sp. CDC160]
MADEQPLIPSRRGPRRKKPVTYRLRVTIQGINPPVFRWIDVSSELFLDDLNEVRGASIGWTDFAAHEFRCGPSFDDPTSERYLRARAVTHGDNGIPENQVRLDELFTTTGDTPTISTTTPTTGRTTSSWKRSSLYHQNTCQTRRSGFVRR